MPNLQYILDVILNDTGAKKNITAIEAELKKLKDFGETGIRVVLDKDGNAIRVLSQLKNQTGAVVDYVREWDEKTQQLVQKTATLGINYEKAAKEQVRAAKEIEQANNAMIATMLQAQMRKKQAVEEEYETNRRLLEQEHELEVESIRRWDAQQRQAEAQAQANRQSIQDYQQLILFAQIFNREVERYVSEHTIWDTVPIQQYIDSLTGVSRAQSQINARTSTFATMSGDAYLEYAERNNLVLTEQERAINGFDRLAASANSTGAQFTALNYIMHRLAYTLLSTVIRSFREALAEMKNVDSELVTISRVTQTSLSDLDNLKSKAYEVGSAYGVMASDYLSAAAAFSRAGYREQAEDLAELSSKLQIAGGVSAEVANQFLIATDKAYQLNGSATELSSVMDKLTVIDHNYATSVEKIADGMGIVAPVAKQAHMSVDELIASLGTITAVTQRSGTEAARALRALILSIIKDTTTELDDGMTWTVEEINSVQDALKLYAPEVVKAAQATGQLIDPMKAIAALAKSYEDGLLTEAKLADLTSKLGGKLRASQLLSLIQNYSGMYTDMLNQMQSATGAVDKDIEKSLESWQVKLNQLKNTFTEFIQKSLSTDTIKGLLDGIRWLIEGFDNLGTVVGLLGTTFVALKITSIIASFSKLSQIITAVGGGFRGWFLTLTNYKTLSAAATKGTNAFRTALEGTSVAASVARVAIGLLALAITGLILASHKYTQKLDERISKGVSSADALDAITKIEDKYKSLIKLYEDGKISEDEYAKGKDDVIKSLQDEGIAVEDLEGKYDSLEEQIDATIRKSKKYKQIEVDDAIKALEKKANGAWTWDAVGYSTETAWAGHYLNGDAVPFFNSKKSFGGYSLTEIVSLYDAAIKRREEIYDKRQKGITLYEKEDERLRAFIEKAESLVTEYKTLTGTLDEFNESKNESVDSGDDLISTTDEEASSVSNLSKELKSATDALDKYKKALEGGEKGDTFKSYADAYKKAVEMYEKGLTGTTAYMSAIDLLFDSGIVNSYEEAGKLLGNTFIKAMFEEGGDDFGANAANYIREHLDEFEGVAIKEANDGTFSVIVTDMEAFAKSAQLSEDALWSLMDALGGFSSDDLDGTKHTLDELEDNKHDVEFTSNLEEFEDEAKKTFEGLDGTVINVKFHGSLDYNTFGGGGGGGKFGQVKQHEATGTKNAVGGATLVNEEGAELIYADGKAWIAGGGQPVVTNLPHGAGVFNARDTRAILTRSGIPSFSVGIPSETEYEPDKPADAVATAKKVKKTDKGGKAGSNEKSLKSILDEISKYVDEILEKAKEALQEQLDAIDEQIDKLKREHDAEEDANKLEELRLKILEAEKKLAEAENERTVRYFNKETGQWEWMADQKAVADAQKALKEAQEAYDKEVAEQEYQAQLQALEDQKDALNDAYNDLADRWSKILEALQESENGSGTTDIAKLLESLGKVSGGTSSDDIAKILEELARFTENPTSALDAETSAKIMSLNGTGGATSVLSAMLGSGSYDLNGKAQSTIGGNTSIVGDTIYYINGVQIGSDMMDKPLSQILSVLPIYAN